MRGTTISIFVPDSNPRSFKVCDMKNSIVKSLFIPRSKLNDVTERDDIKQPGIYFLFGIDEETGQSKVYIGEAEDLLVRIKQHNAKKDFWNTAICFVSEKKNLNKAHIKYLESHCCVVAKKVNKYMLENSTHPAKSSLTEQDEDFVLGFFDDLKILITTLGFPVFEEHKKEKNIFYCSGKQALAEGEYSEDGMIVFASSRASIEITKTAPERIRKIKDDLMKQNVISLDGGVYVFNEDYVFSSPSTAAAFVLGRSANGWTEWKNKKGVTLDQEFRAE